MKGEHGLWPVTLIAAGESLDDTPGSGQHVLGPTILATVSNRVIASMDGVLAMVDARTGRCCGQWVTANSVGARRARPMTGTRTRCFCLRISSSAGLRAAVVTSAVVFGICRRDAPTRSSRMRATAWSRRLDLTASGSGRGRSAASLRWAPEGPVRPVPAAPRVLRVGLSSCA